MLRRSHAPSVAACFLLLALLVSGCTSSSLLTSEYDEDFYHIESTLPDSLTQERYSFLVYGDTQSGWRAERSIQSEEWMSWKQLYLPGVYPLYLIGKGLFGSANWMRGVPDYGGSERLAVQKALVRANARSDASFLLHLGDISANDGRKASHWAYFLRENKTYASPVGQLPILPTPGNHDHSTDSEFGWPNYRAVFDYPHFYVQDSPSATLFVMDSNYLLDQHQAIDDEEQDRLFERWFVSADTSTDRSWLERQLERHADRPFKILAMHHPLVSFSWHHADWHDPAYGHDLIEKRNRLVRLLQRHGVQVAFSGHEHLYEHSRIENAAHPEAPLHAVISSGGGVPTRDLVSPDDKRERQADFEESGFNVKLRQQASRFHYTRVDVTPDTLTLETYAIDPKTTRRTDLIERIEIPAPTPPPKAAQAPAKRRASDPADR